MKLFYKLHLCLDVVLVVMTITLALRVLSTETGLHQSAVHRVSTHEKVIALTFDDGPFEPFTSQVLDVLNRNRVKATFFMVGKRMEKCPDIVRRIAASGHAIGNHTYSHPSDIRLLSPSELIRELERPEKLIEQLTGQRAHLFRPPKGIIGVDGLNIAEKEGYETILWSVSMDHHDAKTPQAMAERVFQRLKSGIIILAHDGYFPSRWRDVVATQILIDGLKRRGYRFVTVPELIDIGKVRH